MALAASSPSLKREADLKAARSGTISPESAFSGPDDASAPTVAGKVRQDALASDDSEGILFHGQGQSQFVSSMHWALLAEEVSLNVVARQLPASVENIS